MTFALDPYNDGRIIYEVGKSEVEIEMVLDRLTHQPVGIALP